MGTLDLRCAASALCSTEPDVSLMGTGMAKQKIPPAAPANPPQLVLKPSAALRASHISSTALGVVNAAVWRGCVLLLAV